MKKRRSHSFRKEILILTCFFLLIFVPVSVGAATPFSSNGRLSISKGRVVNEKGKAFVIKGVSTHGLAWYPDYVNKTAFKNLRDSWGVNTIRLALYTAEYNGYCTGGNQQELESLLERGVQYATELGMYVIIDWHILNDGNPLTYKKQSLSFFKKVAKKYADYENVIYEICNEPNGSGGSWSNIKSYAKSVIKAIRGVNKKAIIIVGTPTWSQDVDVAETDRITGYSNIAYAFHFYADTHQDVYRNKLEGALKKGLPVIVTEFGITDASGNGNVNQTQGSKWISLLDKYSIGRVCWNLSNKNESSALLKSSCTKKNGWKYSDLSEQGKWLVSVYHGKIVGTSAAPTPTPMPKPTALPTPVPTQAAGNTQASKSSASKTAASTGKVKLKATLKKENSWKSGNKYYTQFKLTIKNTGSRASSKWTVTANFGSKVVRNGQWSAVFSSSGKKLTIKPVDWNKNIKKNQTTEIGFILEASKVQKITSLTITAG